MHQSLRERLVDAGRVLASEGQGDYVAGHVSVRLPDDPGRFLMKPAGIGIEEMRPDNIITIDIESRRVDVYVPAAALAERLRSWAPPPPRYPFGVLAKYAATVGSASLGALTSRASAARA